MKPSKAVKEYKEELVQVNKENEMLTKIVGKMTVEKEWLEKKLKSLGLSDKKEMIESELKTTVDPIVKTTQLKNKMRV